MSTFALVLFLAVNGQIHSFVLDHGLTASDCRTEQKEHRKFEAELAGKIVCQPETK